MATDSHAGTYERACAQPCAPLNNDWLHDEVESWRLVVVTSGAKKRSLRNADVAFYGDGGEVQKPRIFAKPNVVSQGKLPRKRNARTRLDNHALSHLCAKTLEHQPFKCEELERAKPEYQQPHQQPQPFFENGSAKIKSNRILR